MGWWSVYVVPWIFVPYLFTLLVTFCFIGFNIIENNEDVEEGTRSPITVYCWHQEESKIIWAATWQNQQSECAPCEDSDQPGHPPNLIRAFVVRMKKPWVLTYALSAQRRLRLDWADDGAHLINKYKQPHIKESGHQLQISLLQVCWVSEN